jgi:hypothetical protein
MNYFHRPIAGFLLETHISPFALTMACACLLFSLYSSQKGCADHWPMQLDVLINFRASAASWDERYKYFWG